MPPEPEGIALTEEAHERVSRTVREVEGGGVPDLRTRPDRPEPNQIKLGIPTTNVQPSSFTETTFTWHRATATTTAPTATTKTETVYDWFGWGVNKEAKAIAFRPLPSKQRYIYQPPAAQLGQISATGSGSCEVNPTTVVSGGGLSADPGTTFTVQLPQRDGVDNKLSVGDVVAYMPTHWGEFVCVSDYSEIGGETFWGKVTSAGVTTGAASTDPDTVDINPSTNAIGDNTDTDTTYTIVLPRRDGQEHKLTGGDVIAWANTEDSDRVIVSDYSAGGVANWGKVTSAGVTTGSASTDPDTVHINPSTNAVGDNTDTDTTYTIILPRRDGLDHKLTAGDVVAWMNTADADRVIVSDYTDDTGGGGGGGGTVSKAGHYSMSELFTFATTPTTDNPLDLGSFTGSTSLDGFGLATTGTYTLECTTPTKLLMNFSAGLQVVNNLQAALSTRMNVGFKLVLNSSIVVDTVRDIGDWHTTGVGGNRWGTNGSFEWYHEFSSGDQVYILAAARAIPSGSSARLRSGLWTFTKVEEPEATRTIGFLQYELQESPGLTGNSTTQYLTFANSSATINDSSDVGLESTAAGSTKLNCTIDGGGKFDVAYTLTPRVDFQSTNATSGTQQFDVRTQLQLNGSDIAQTRRRYSFTVPTTHLGYNLYGGTLAARTLLQLSSGDEVGLEFEVRPNAPSASSWTVVEGEVSILRLDQLL